MGFASLRLRLVWKVLWFSSIISLACGQQTFRFCGSRQQPADVIFVLDESGSVGKSNFRTTLKFVENVTKHFNMGEEAIQIGVMTFSTTVVNEIALNKIHDLPSLHAEVNKIGYNAGGTHTHKALDQLRTQGFTVSNGGRIGVARIGIIVTDGKSNYPKDTLPAAESCKNEGLIMFAIGIGKGIDKGELEAIASEPVSSHLFTVKDFQTLLTAEQEVVKETCDALEAYAMQFLGGGASSLSEGQMAALILGLMGVAGLIFVSSFFLYKHYKSRSSRRTAQVDPESQTKAKKAGKAAPGVGKKTAIVTPRNPGIFTPHTFNKKASSLPPLEKTSKLTSNGKEAKQNKKNVKKESKATKNMFSNDKAKVNPK